MNLPIRLFSCYNFVCRNLTLFISITQIYEWMGLRLIIIWQSTKDLTQAILMLKETTQKQLFLESEQRIEKWWKFCAIIIILQMIGTTVFYGIYSVLNILSNLYLINEFVIFIGLIYSYKELVLLLRKLHAKRYIEVRFQIAFFFLCEAIPITLSCVNKVIWILHINTEGWVSNELYELVTVFNVILWICYPFL